MTWKQGGLKNTEQKPLGHLYLGYLYHNELRSSDSHTSKSTCYAWRSLCTAATRC
jgi:hypothetical protein